MISKEDAISAVRSAFYSVVPSNPSTDVREIFWKCMNNLRDLPTSDDENIEILKCKQCKAMDYLSHKGHWIETEYHRYRCPICREKGMSDWDNIHDKKTDFCPNCGADMRGDTDADSN